MTACVRDLLAQGREQLAAASAQAAELEARILLAHVLDRPPSWLYAWPEYLVDAAGCERFHALIAQRCHGHPIAYLTGSREFWSLTLQVNEHTLIPRPETEHLVEVALALGPAGAANVLDLGTGSGAIALALASERPAWRVCAVDRSAGALKCAVANAHRLALNNVQCLHGDWFGALAADTRFDLIVSNPPYIAATDTHLQQGDLRFEPTSALAAGPEGLDDLRYLIAHAASHLHPTGWLVLEHGHDQGSAVRELFAHHNWQSIDTRRDLAGHARLSLAQCPVQA